MGTFINDKGETVMIRQNQDGSITVCADGGARTTYGKQASMNVYRDFGLEGQDLTQDGVFPDPDAHSSPDSPDSLDPPDILDSPDSLNSSDDPDSPDGPGTPDSLDTPDSLNDPDSPDSPDDRG